MEKSLVIDMSQVPKSNTYKQGQYQYGKTKAKAKIEKKCNYFIAW
jgi:hypothetical protein